MDDWCCGPRQRPATTKRKDDEKTHNKRGKTGETRDGGTRARGTSNDERTGELRDVVGRERWWCVTDGGKGTEKQ